MALNRQRSMETDPNKTTWLLTALVSPSIRSCTRRLQRFLDNSDSHPRCKKTCPLYPPKADMGSALAYVCFGPIADMRLFESPR